MTDESPGPGWWLASDGRWYSPDQAPGTRPVDWPAPTAPSEPSSGWGLPPAAPPIPRAGLSTGGKVAVVAGALLGALVLLIAVVALLGEDTEAPSSAPALVPADAADVPPSYETFTDPDGEFSLALHPSWLGLSLRGDVTGAGSRAIPDDPERAAALDAMISAAPRQVLFLAADGDGLGSDRFVANINLISIPRDGASIDDVAAEAAVGVAGFGGTDARVERTTTSSGEALRMTYRFASGGPLRGVEGIQYYLFAGETVWVLTLTSDDMDAHRAIFDLTAASFVAQ